MGAVVFKRDKRVEGMFDVGLWMLDWRESRDEACLFL
jgi:hypothetical protein